jgi:adenylate kinase
MRLLMLAPPGAGKGTQSQRLATHFGIEHISSGELLRQEVRQGSQLGQALKGFVDRGDLVPDDIVLRVVADRVVAAADAGGYVLDGYPRNIHQAEEAYRIAKEHGVELDAAIHLSVSREELLRRLGARAVSEGRGDDTTATIVHRLDVFDQQTEPLLAYYERRGVLISVNGEASVEEVTAEILDRLREHPPAARPPATSAEAVPRSGARPGR